jgi:hypothetical protein
MLRERGREIGQHTLTEWRIGRVQPPNILGVADPTVNSAMVGGVSGDYEDRGVVYHCQVYYEHATLSEDNF